MIKVIESRGKTLISVIGIQRIEGKNVNELGRLIEGHIRSNHEIILNLNKVFYIDTEGFKTLLCLKQKAERAGGRISLMQLSGVLSDMFRLMELGDKFEWASTEQFTDTTFTT